MNRVEGRLRPRLFILLSFRPNEKAEKLFKTIPYLIFQARPKFVQFGRFLFYRVLYVDLTEKATRSLTGAQVTAGTQDLPSNIFTSLTALLSRTEKYKISISLYLLLLRFLSEIQGFLDRKSVV